MPILLLSLAGQASVLLYDAFLIVSLAVEGGRSLGRKVEEGVV